MRPRFYYPKLSDPVPQDGLIELDLDQSRHARKVLRLSVGDQVELIDGQGTFAVGLLEAVKPSRTVCRLLESRQIHRLSPSVAVAAAIPKGSRADQMINQLSQTGADRFIPLRTRRSIVDPSPSKLDRFSRMAIESAKQSRRHFVMVVEQPCELAQVLAEPYDLRLLADPLGGTTADLAEQLAVAGSVLVLIGPEGGWSEKELEAARSAGCVRWTIGPNVLRVETASVVAVGVVRHLAQKRLPFDGRHPHR